jgi:aminoglycoside phosphotransferase (APT) family kinase protein
VAFWGWEDELDLVPLENRYSVLNSSWLAAEGRQEVPDSIVGLATEGWERFAQRAPRAVAATVLDLRRDVDPLVEAVRTTPATFLHGDWKLGNLGTRPDGRSVLLDWTYPGAGPPLHELAWYLALNRSRLPESKEAAIDALRASFERRGIDTAPWWEHQLGLCLLGAVVQFGWEKALGDERELQWWCDRAHDGARWLA